MFAAVWGCVHFREVPDGPTVLGMAMIAGAGLMLLIRGRREAVGRLAPSESPHRPFRQRG